MAIKEIEVEIDLVRRNYKHYESLGYKIPKTMNKQGKMVLLLGTKLVVRVEDLSSFSRTKVTKICDECGKVIPNVSWNDINYQREKSQDGKDRCFNCGKRVGGDSLVKRYVNDKNCIAKVNAEFAELFWNKEDTFTHTCQSNRKADFKCPNCGNKITMTIEKAFRRGLSCNRCSDGISYPQKFVFNVLYQLKVKTETQKSFEWSCSKKYDFYIENMNCIIEAHGGQHYEDNGKCFGSMQGGRSTLEEIANDILKKEVALENGIKNYIVIDSSVSEFEFMRRSIEGNEDFTKLFNISEIDWKDCHRYACKSIVKDTCDKYNEGIKDSNKLAAIIGINRTTVQRYLKKGNKIGLCDYNPQAKLQAKREEEQKRKEAIENSKKIVQLSLLGKFIAEYSGVAEANKVFNVNTSHIYSVVRKERPKVFNSIWVFKEEYENMTNEDILELVKKANAKYEQPKKAVCQFNKDMNLINEFDSVSNAQEQTGIGHISSACNGSRKFAGGYKWMFKEDYVKSQMKKLC